MTDQITAAKVAGACDFMRLVLSRLLSTRSGAYGHFAQFCRLAAYPMNRIAAALLVAITVPLAGCATPDVKYSDLQPPATATLAGGTVTVHLGSDLTASACWTTPKARVEGNTVYVAGYRTLHEQSREFVVRLPASTNPHPVSVFWLNPDGTRVAVPIKQ